jgi:serine/threonine-protein kinase
MHRESAQRAAALAVAKYGLDRAHVERLLQATLLAQSKGEAVDLLDVLVYQDLLNATQASALRLELHLKPPEDALPDPGPPAAGFAPRASTFPFEFNRLGAYSILRRLGDGAMSTVYLGYHEEQRTEVAIKVLADHLVSNQDYVDRFYREAKSATVLNHPNIVHGITAGQDQATSKHYMVLEYVDGPSAEDLLEEYGRLSVGDAVHITLDIARALEHAHSRNIVHRDIKPTNILLTRTGVAKLADLGLAKRIDETSHLTAMRQGFGTPYYMPYEQAVNAKNVDGRSDIYALGATLYHLVTGEVPFSARSPLEIIEKKGRGVYPAASSVYEGVPPALDRILDQMMALRPRDRYQMASELIVDLERAELAAPVLSFVNLELAMQDPLTRARLTTPAQATVPDLRRVAGAAGNGDPDVWYVRYRDPKGRWCKAKMTTEQIVQRLRRGRIPEGTEACHEAQGEYRPLDAWPELHP